MKMPNNPLSKGKERFIEQLGERGLIETIVNKFNANANRRIVTVGAGEDDCAVIDVDNARGGRKYLVVTTDTVQESTHLPKGISPFQIGWTAAAVNLSDIAAMGAHPFAFMVAMGVPAHTETAFVDEMGYKEHKKDKTLLMLRRILGRAELTGREVQTLRGVLRKAEWEIEKQSK